MNLYKISFLLLLLCCLFVIPLKMIGQEDIEQKIKYLIDLHKAHPDSDSVLMYLDTALIYADSLKSRSLEAEINRHYGNYYYHNDKAKAVTYYCLLYTSPSPRDQRGSRMPSSA